MQSVRKPLGTIRHDWQISEVQSLFQLPFNDLLFQAQSIHRQVFDPNEVQLSTLLSIKTGACPEDCAYCPQSGHHNAKIEKERLLPLDEVLVQAKAAQSKGATRFCMGAAWRSPSQKDFPKVLEMVEAVKGLGMETCMTLGMLDKEQAQSLKTAGLDYYNHNIDTSPEYYADIITTRTYADRLQTLENVREAKMKVCCGGIVGMGEQPEDRAEMLRQLANLPEHPQSVPVNQLVAVPGTPLENQDAIGALDFVRTIAVARIMMPASVVRLSAGREAMSSEMQALCFFAGANSIFYGDKLLTTSNPCADRDAALLKELGIRMQKADSLDEAKMQDVAAL